MMGQHMRLRVPRMLTCQASLAITVTVAAAVPAAPVRQQLQVSRIGGHGLNRPRPCASIRSS